MDHSRFTRRDAIQYGAALSAVGLATATGVDEPALANTAAARPEIFAGHIVRIDGARRLAMRLAGQKRVLEVTLARGAHVLRGASGVVRGFAPFAVGEEIAVSGQLRGTTVTASQVGSVYRQVAGTMRADHGSYLATSAGTLYLSARVRSQVKTVVPGPGQRFVAEVWRNPRTGRREISSIGPAS